MAQAQANLEFNTFVKGLITEASPLTFPENSSLDEDNMVLNRDGSRQRRLGMEYENNYAFTASEYTNAVFQSNNVRVGFYRWDNVENDPAVSLGVIQVGEYLYFYDLYSAAPSANRKNSSSTYTIFDLSASTKVQFTTVGGKLVAVLDSDEIYVFSYNSTTDTITREDFDPLVRDIWGIDDSLDTDERPTSLSAAHEYNLYNQGWPLKTVRDTSGNMRRAHIHYYNQTGTYPSNADIWYFGQQPDGSLTKFEGQTIESQWFGNTQAPKGHFVINAFTRSSSRNSKSGLSTATDITYGGITAVASYAGRLFVSGINIFEVDSNVDTTPKMETFVMFSQVVSSDDKINKFYQEADPTQQDSAGLVATDGGVIPIPEASRIFKLIPTANSLVVIAENGVWTILGSDAGFSATNYQVVKVSNIGAINADSVIEAEGRIFYWSKAGIYTLVPDEVTGSLTPQNLSEVTIQSFYTSIPSVGKSFAKGTYDEAARKVRWLYSDQSDYNGITYVDHFNRELVLDLTLGAFYTNTIPAAYDSVSVADFVSTPNYLSEVSTDDVISGVDDIVIGADDVVISENVRSRGTSTTKYLTVRPGTTYAEFTLSEYRDATFTDWFTYDGTGVDAAAYLETGYFTGGDSTRSKWAPYLTVHCKRTETGYSLDGSGNIVFDTPSSCLIQGRWDFSDSANSGKWSDQYQAYRLNRIYIPASVSDPFDYGYNIVTTKNKLRGNGKALRLRFDTEAGKDLYIYGWGLAISQEPNV